MSQLPKSNGDAQPVFHHDVASSVSSASPALNIPVNFVGPAMDFFGIDLGLDPSQELGPMGALQSVIATIQQLTNIAIYQVSPTDAAVNMSVAVYPKHEITASELESEIQALGTVDGYDLSSATVTDVGFRLATSLVNPS